MTSTFTYTADFREEFAAETASLLRRRFILFAVANLALFVLTYFCLPLFSTLLVVFSERPGEKLNDQLETVLAAYFTNRGGLTAIILLTIAQCAIVLASVSSVRRRNLGPADLAQISQWVFFCMGAVSVASSIFVHSVGFPWLLAASHLLASLMLPWDPRQAIRPMVPLLILNAATILAFTGWPVSVRFIMLTVSALSAVPGSAACILRHSRRTERFKLRFLQNRYGQIRRELTDARRIHESLFPKPHNRGPVRFDYRYEPMRQIGGDYLYAKFSPVQPGAAQALNALLIDVTGHGIAAALTVNRLYGEVERVFAEDPHASPGDVLRALNRYVHLTLANHSIYATALCLRIDPTLGKLEYASGGHPPAFLRAVDGTIDQLPSTSFVLGAVGNDLFDPGQEMRRFGPGDTLVAYTDGAIEARNENGRMLGVAGLERILASAPPAFDGGWASVIVSAVEAHRLGPATDDTLVVEIVRMLGLDTDSVKTGRARTRGEAPATV